MPSRKKTDLSQISKRARKARLKRAAQRAAEAQINGVEGTASTEPPSRKRPLSQRAIKAKRKKLTKAVKAANHQVQLNKVAGTASIGMQFDTEVPEVSSLNTWSYLRFNRQNSRTLSQDSTVFEDVCYQRSSDLLRHVNITNEPETKVAQNVSYQNFSVKQEPEEIVVDAKPSIELNGSICKNKSKNPSKQMQTAESCSVVNDNVSQALDIRIVKVESSSEVTEDSENLNTNSETTHVDVTSNFLSNSKHNSLGHIANKKIGDNDNSYDCVAGCSKNVSGHCALSEDEPAEKEAHEVELALECQEELLSPAQRSVHKKDWIRFVSNANASNITVPYLANQSVSCLSGKSFQNKNVPCESKSGPSKVVPITSEVVSIPCQKLTPSKQVLMQLSEKSRNVLKIDSSHRKVSVIQVFRIPNSLVPAPPVSTAIPVVLEKSKKCFPSAENSCSVDEKILPIIDKI